MRRSRLHASGWRHDRARARARPLRRAARVSARDGAPRRWGRPRASRSGARERTTRGARRREGPARRYYDDGDLFIEEHLPRGRAGRRVRRVLPGRREGARGQRTRAARRRGSGRSGPRSGAREEEAEFRDGVPHGRFTAFWPTGAKKTEGRRCGGAQCGPWRSWDDRGSLVGSGEYGEPSLTP